MAMLAEKKRREKWCLNPRGKHWSDDQSKLGQRLLEKMGWSAGQGLGVNKQGPTEIIKVKKKDDSKGLGFKENGEEWTKTTSEYNELLDQLANTEGNDKDQTNVTMSLEDRSKKSKARVHYHKFTRGKDLSRYSEKDLASIIGPEVVSKSSSNLQADYKPNQINKGSYIDYFESKKGIKRDHASEPDIDGEMNNQDDIAGEETAHSNVKKLKKSKKVSKNNVLCTEEQSNELEDLSKTKICSEHTEELENYDLIDNVNSKYKKQSKKKNKKLENESNIQIETHETKSQFELVNTNLNMCSEENEVIKRKNKKKNLITAHSVEEIENENIGKESTQQSEDYLCDKLLTNKKRKKYKHCESDSIINESPMESQTCDKVNTTQNEEESVGSLNTDGFVKKKKAKRIKDETAKEKEVEEPIKLNYLESENNSVKSKKEKKISIKHGLRGDCMADKIKEHDNENDKDSEITFKSKTQNYHCEEQVEEVIENKSVKRKKTKITKEEKKDDIIESSVNLGIKKKKVQKVNQKEDLITSLNESKDIGQTDLNLESGEGVENLIVQSKLGKKSKSQRSEKLEVEESIDPEILSDVPKNKVKKEKKHSKNKDNETNAHMTADNNNEDSNVKSDKVLTVFGRKTRLRGLNMQKEAKPSKFETEEFMSFNDNTSVSNKNVELHNTWSNSIVTSLLPKIYVKPTDDDRSMTMNVANYEYRLLSRKVKELGINSLDVKIIIKDSASLPAKLRKKLKLLYKSKYLKTILPEDVLVDIEESVKNFSHQLQNKINMMKELLELQSETSKIGSELQECSEILKDERKDDESDFSVRVKTLKVKVKELLAEVGGRTASNDLENNQDMATSMKSPHSKFNNGRKLKELTSNNLTRSSDVPPDSLQMRIENKIKTLTDQMKLLGKGKQLPVDPSNSENDVTLKTNHVQKTTLRNNQRRDWTNNQGDRHSSTKPRSEAKDTGGEDDYSSVKTDNNYHSYSSFAVQPFRSQNIQSSWGKGYGYGLSRGRGRGLWSSRMGQTGFRGQMRGRGPVVRGRISKNNFDAKQYAEKCKTMNKVPEITFNGVDLKVISGYAAEKKEASNIDSGS